MNFQQNWLKVLECVETLINYYIWLFATSFQLFCEIKCDIFEKKSINNHFKQPWIPSLTLTLTSTPTPTPILTLKQNLTLILSD